MRKILFAGVKANKPIIEKSLARLIKYRGPNDSPQNRTTINTFFNKLKKAIYKPCSAWLASINAENPFNILDRFSQRNYMIRPIAHCACGALSS